MAMKLLATFTDENLNLTGEQENSSEKSREAARSIILNAEGHIAVLYTEKHGHHKLPGGGIEFGEDFEVALERESMEEAGCYIKIIGEIGKIEEHRGLHNFKQTSYCAIVTVVGNCGANDLTESEILEGYTALKWVSKEEAKQLFENDKPKTYIGAYMHARDQRFLDEYIINYSENS